MIQFVEVVALIAACVLPIHDVESANILGVFPTAAKSHWIALKPLLKELDKRGHAITVITPFQEKDVSTKWKTILAPEEVKGMPANFGKDLLKASQSFDPFFLYKMLTNMGLASCDELFALEDVQQLIHTDEKKFDLLIMEHFTQDCFLAFAHKFKIPVIGMAAFGGFHWTLDKMGNPTQPSYIPDSVLEYTDHMNFYERLRNTVMSLYARYIYHYNYVPKADDLIRKYFKHQNIPSITDIDVSLLILMSHPSFSSPRPLLPNVIEAGGMHVEPPKKLPEELQKYLDDSKDGVIYFSLGSHFKSSAFPAEIIAAFVSVFSKLKQRVLWKWEQDSLPDQPTNVKLGKWFPQPDLLAHKNVKLFITHGGLQSTIEATSRGVPLLALPITADQKLNAIKSVASGYCVQLELSNITTRSLEWAMTEMLNNPKYYENAQLRSRLFHDRPQKPVETAVYWTEYVLRHNGAPHMRSAALDLSWYQYLLLDVIAALFAAIFSLLILTALSLRMVYRRFTTGKPATQSVDTKQTKKKQ